MFHRFIIALAATTMLAAPALAAPHSHGKTHVKSAHGKHAGTGCKPSAAMLRIPAVREYVAANEAMHKGMMVPYTGDADIDFVTGMIPHHQGAVDMANIQLKYGKDEELKKLARWIITAQESEIGFMKQWIKGRTSRYVYPDAAERESTKAYAASMSAMHHGMNIGYTGDADVDFARGMIPHHQGAIDMAWVLKDHGRDPKLRAMATEIIRSQAQEIAQMKAWLEKRAMASFDKAKPMKHNH